MTRSENPIHPLPPIASLSPATVTFLNAKFTTKEDLHDHAPLLVLELRTECRTLDQCLSDLDVRLNRYVGEYSSNSTQIGSSLKDVKQKLSDLHSSTLPSSSADEGLVGLLGEELPALAKEVARVEAVRLYAETALKLDTLVGDIEDAVSLSVNRTLRRRPSKNNSEDIHADAIRKLKLTEDTLSLIAKTNPQWIRLISAVDHRVDRALAVFRPQAIADHRALLASLAWPPPLSSLNSSTLDIKQTTEVENPLFTIEGDLKHQYCSSFLALCSLQEFQQRRKTRQLQGQTQNFAIKQPLWAVEELVNPLAINSQRHFSKWVDTPEFIFALVYKTTRDYVDSMDELLQPLVDEALLHGYSCREEWVSAMVSSLSTYMAKEILPSYVAQLEEESSRSQARLSWLHLIDLMIAFDKRVQSLVAHSGILHSVAEEGNHEKVSSLSVFRDRPDWLDLWAGIELDDAIEKAEAEIADERNWSIKSQHTAGSSNPGDNKSPSISSAFLRILSYVVDRCRSLPSISLRSRFVKLVCIPIVDKLVNCLLLRCVEAEGLTALTDNDGLVKVANSINAAQHFTSVFKEWCEDVFFLEIGLNQDGDIETLGADVGFGKSFDASRSSDFDNEVVKLEKFILEWVDKLSTVILRGFDASCRDYVKNRNQWQERGEEGWGLSRQFVGALDYLQSKLAVLEENLNHVDFVKVWRTLASGIDQLFLRGIFLSGAKFHDSGVKKLENDMEVMFGVFRRWCLRPEGFFPKVSEGLKLLKMEIKQIQNGLDGGQRWLKENRITHLTLHEAEKIANNRIHGS